MRTVPSEGRFGETIAESRSEGCGKTDQFCGLGLSVGACHILCYRPAVVKIRVGKGALPVAFDSTPPRALSTSLHLAPVHTHAHPRLRAQVLSASLDQTVRVWDIGGLRKKMLPNTVTDAERCAAESQSTRSGRQEPVAER